MKQTIAMVSANDEIARDYYKMVFEWDPAAGEPLPGQFVTIRVADTSVPLLRRPFAFSGYSRNAGQGEMIYLKRGKGTEILSTISPGKGIDVLGPLGNYLENPGEDKQPILIAGGIGLGPILFYSSVLNRENISHTFLFGARTAEAVPQMEISKNTNPDICNSIICTDDGSAGFRGTVVDCLKTLSAKGLHNAVLYCCGPFPMLKACHAYAMEYGYLCYVVMEQIMACGVGACMGCTIKVKTGFARVCMEGPVFDSREVIWT